ncbi:protoporphyrinogen oxidase [Thermomicrobium sp. 4228-Ro]|uniref:protoporphyrinogen oxidase n=1 Tax=Thermomicrobium sp. 4228-Ro TaxID=2993937 RepID=UPI002248F521|nr:protoporphyrinogen oxidase [Thermomicrobium sp. 4228-Ro]MCX2726604.1 protoporphyrinogen oxidase [Thermomicrobium sp. 4228-Ro]
MAAQIVVVGGGITGLAACWRLERQYPGVSITLVEASERLGGWIRSERWNGVLIEHGPDSWVASKAAATELARALGLEPELVGLRADRAGTGIVLGGRILPLPEGLSLLVPTRLWPILTSPLLSVPGKIRLLGELFVPARCHCDDESLAAFVRRRFGREFYERLAEPLLAGIYAGDAEQLSLLATYPQFRQLECQFGSLLRALWRRHHPARSLRSGVTSPFLTLWDGMQRLVDRLALSLQRTAVLVGVPAISLEPTRPHGYRVVLSDGAVLEADGVVIATPAASAVRLLQPVLADEAAWLHTLPYASSAAVTFVYRDADLEPIARGRGFLVPARESRAISAVTWVTNKFPARAPEGLSVARVFFRGAGTRQCGEGPSERLVALALQELRSLVGLRADPLHAVVSRHDRAMPQYPVGHRDRTERLRLALRRWRGLAVAGAAFDGVGVPDCIASGWRAADTVLETLGLSPGESSGLDADPAA